MTLDDVRIHIDSVDRELRQLIEKRMDFAHNVADAKLATGDRIFKPDREELVITRLTSNTRPDILKQYTALIKKIMLVSREYQYSLTLNHLEDAPVKYTDTSDAINTINIDAIENVEYTLHECKAAGNYVCSFIRKDNSATITLSSELVGNNDTGHILLYIDTPEYASHISQILNIIADFDIQLTWIHTGAASCSIELATSITNIQTMVMLFMLTSEHEYINVIGSY